MSGFVKDLEPQEWVVYTPASQLRSPKTLVREMWHDLTSSHELAWQLFIRDIKKSYRESFLGLFWAILPPVMTAFGFVFLNSANVLNVSDTEIPYPAFVLFGTTLWKLFTSAFGLPASSAGGRNLLKDVAFPPEVLILQAGYQLIFNFLLSSLPLIGAFFAYGLQVNPGLILFPLALLPLAGLGLVLGTLLMPVKVMLPDVRQAITMALPVWMLLTPVAYPPPDTWPYSLLIRLNPVTPLLDGARDLVTLGRLQDPTAFIVTAAVVVILLPFAWLAYRLTILVTIERLGA
jgi:lipopolysaccharide transport system permease protein